MEKERFRKICQRKFLSNLDMRMLIKGYHEGLSDFEKLIFYKEKLLYTISCQTFFPIYDAIRVPVILYI